MNKKVEVLVNQLLGIQNLIQRIQAIEKEVQGQPQVDANKILELAKLYQDAGKFQQFMMVGSQILGNTNLPSVYHFRLAQLYANIRRMPEMVTALNLSMRELPPNLKPEIYLELARLWALAQEYDKTYLDKMQSLLQTYLKLQPADWKARLDHASILIALGKMDEASQALNECIRFGGEEARALIMQNPRFAPALKHMAPPTSGGMRLPGFPDLPKGLPPMPSPRPR
jgi:tetratricopeptide (TPR) repeat protein